MLSINFKGRYNRQQFWVQTFLILFLMVITNVFIMTLQGFLYPPKYNLMESMLAKRILDKQGSIKHEDIERLKESIENDKTIMDDKSGATLMVKAELNEMSEMSDAQLKELGTQERPKGANILLGINLIISLFLWYCLYTVNVKRGHDLNISGWITFFASCLPLINFIYFIYLGSFKGKQTENKYGQPSLSRLS